MRTKTLPLVLICTILFSIVLRAQVVPVSADFLRLPVNVRGAGMGNLSVANGGDANSVFGNPALIAFNDENNYNEISSFSSTFSPIAVDLTKDIKYLTLNGHTWINQGEYIGMSLQYLSLGDVHFYDSQANETNFVRPNEWAIGGTYAKQFNSSLGMGITFKGIFSSLTGGAELEGIKTRGGFALAADFGLYGRIPDAADNEISYGFALTNIGSKINYSDSEEKSFLPMALRFGGGYKYIINESYVRVGLELNKMLIPSQPIYDQDRKIIKGEDPNKTVPGAIFSSFNDHPDGISGEIKEFGLSIGAEAGFNDSFFFRGGIYSEAKQMGLGSFASVGLGFKKEFSNKRLGIDIAYLIPTGENFSLKSSFKFGISLSISE